MVKWVSRCEALTFAPHGYKAWPPPLVCLSVHPQPLASLSGASHWPDVSEENLLMAACLPLFFTPGPRPLSFWASSSTVEGNTLTSPYSLLFSVFSPEEKWAHPAHDQILWLEDSLSSLCTGSAIPCCSYLTFQIPLHLTLQGQFLSLTITTICFTTCVSLSKALLETVRELSQNQPQEARPSWLPTYSFFWISLSSWCPFHLSCLLYKFNLTLKWPFPLSKDNDFNLRKNFQDICGGFLIYFF